MPVAGYLPVVAPFSPQALERLEKCREAAERPDMADGWRTAQHTDGVVARHERLRAAGQTRYEWQHYIPLLQRKPEALRNRAPFADLPAPLQQLRRTLLRHTGGDRVLAIARYDGLRAPDGAEEIDHA